jgi:hypothetical protein
VNYAALPFVTIALVAALWLALRRAPSVASAL